MAALDDVAGEAMHGNPAGADRLEGDRRGVESIAQLVGDESQALHDRFFDAPPLRFLPFGDRPGDASIERLVERLVLAHGNGGARAARELEGAVAEASVLVDQLVAVELD